ncbi:ADP-ribosylglycohydrolase family protein [Gelidibacter japonicus]|uniref:ADP-ribosylglycohydrolase family protein n=1 Tax=Gelidibacter japonicus TaxID=1962232 RepID=UPI002B001359|nr:ADP-ribosylglycohydrolase family protein [Gelidibacter japonicus]
MRETRYKNSIQLSAIGDSLGWITEFEKSIDSIIEKYGVSEIESFYKWEKHVGGRFNGYLDRIKSGSYSDDTQLLLSVARSIKQNGDVDNVYFSKTELPSWLKYARGAGRTIKNAAKKIERKSATWNNNFFNFKAGKTTIDYRESGANGAAMRILPISLANHNDFDKIKENIFANSIVTHGHPRAIVGAILYGFAIDVMLNQKVESFNYQSYLTELGKDIELKLKLNFITKPQFKSWLSEWNKNQENDFMSVYNETVQEALNSLRDVFKFIRDGKDTKSSLIHFGCYAPSTKGSGISTVVGGVYLAIKHYQNPEQAILEAVNSIGTDSDSIAAFAGGLIGCLYENEIIPNKWMGIQDSEYLNRIAQNLYEISINGTFETNRNQIELSLKSLNEISLDEYLENEEIFFNPLGKGIITNIDRQKTLTSGKYNLIIDVNFEIGQTCKFSKLLDIEKNEAERYFK